MSIRPNRTRTKHKFSHIEVLNVISFRGQSEKKTKQQPAGLQQRDSGNTLKSATWGRYRRSCLSRNHNFIPVVGTRYFSKLLWCLIFFGQLECFSHVSTAQMLKFWSLAGDRWRAGSLWAHSSTLRFMALNPSSKFLSWTGEHLHIKHEKKNVMFEFLCRRDPLIPDHRRSQSTVSSPNQID